jgi:hypothetical protein
MLAEGEALVTQVLRGRWGDRLVSPRSVMASPSYALLPFRASGRTIRPHGYKPVPRTADRINRIPLEDLAADLSVDGLVSVDLLFHFKSKPLFGIETARVPQTALTVTLYDAGGVSVFRSSYVRVGPKTFLSAEGVFSRQDMVDGLRTALASAVQAFELDLAKKAARGRGSERSRA